MELSYNSTCVKFNSKSYIINVESMISLKKKKSWALVLRAAICLLLRKFHFTFKQIYFKIVTNPNRETKPPQRLFFEIYFYLQPK